MVSLNNLQLTDLDNHRIAYLETIFSIANGHFGIRASDPVAPSSTSGTLVNGFYESSPITYGERAVGYAENHQTIVNLPDLRKIKVSDSDGALFAKSELLTSNLDFQTGILSQSYKLTNPTGKNITLTFDSIVDQADQKAGALKYEFTAGTYHGQITIGKSLAFNATVTESDDPRKARQITSLDITTTVDSNDQKELLIETQNSKLAVAMRLKALDGTLLEQSFDLAKGPAVARYLVCVSDFANELTPPTADLEDVTFEQVLADSKNYWQTIWNSSQIEIDGDDRLTQAIRYNLFQLNQSAGRDGKTNISAKGLSGTGYEGHYFWDTEMYLMPYFTYSTPMIAKKLLDFRYNTLDIAKQQAKTLGVSEGALFPWRTINGEEASAYYPAGTAQYHIDGDIAYAANRYYEATNDRDWLVEKGYELILETARFWSHFGHFHEVDGKNRFEFYGVTGPNEYTVMVDNNYYTNRIAKHNLHLAVRLAKIVSEVDPNKLKELHVTDEELEKFENIADVIYLPYNQQHQVNAQDDSFFNKPIWPFKTTKKDQYPLLLHFHPLTIYRYQVAKQADTILAEFLFPQDVGKDQLQREYDYYESITTHDSSLSRSVFSMIAARLHDSKQAYDYFMTTAKMDLVDLQGNTEDGLHLSNLGGSWLALTAGFAGMTFEEGKLHLINNLPQQWKALKFRIRLQDNLFAIELTKNDIDVKLLEGTSANVMIDGKWREITRTHNDQKILN